MIKLKSLITEQEFKAKSKETGRVVVYKSKDSMDKAIKGGRAEPLDKKTSGKPEKTKGADLFKKDVQKKVQKKKTDTNITTKADGTKVIGDKVETTIKKNGDVVSDDMKNLIKNTKDRVDLNVKNFKDNKMPVGISKDDFEEPVYIENGKLYNGGKEINLEGGDERSGFSWLSSDELSGKLAVMAKMSGGIPVKGGKQKVSKPVKVSKQAVKKVSDLSNEIEKNIDDAYGDLDSDKRDDFATTLQNVGTTLEDEIDYDALSQEDRKEFDQIFGDIEDQVMHLQNDESGMGSIEGDPREVSKRAVKFINKFSTKNEGIIKLKSLLSEKTLNERPNQDTEKLSKILGKNMNDIYKFVTKYGIEEDDLLDVLDAGSSSQRRRYSMAILAAMKGNRRALKDLDNLLGFL
tara:strand:- start:717 stop:1931 length:1215 start_codon:yes stop_codon:yes gene_type:complete